MTRLLHIGFVFCVAVVCMLPVTGSAALLPESAALEKRVAALEKAVATLQAQVAALQKASAAQQQLQTIPGGGAGTQQTESK